MSAYAMVQASEAKWSNSNLEALAAEMVALADEADALLEAYANRIPEKVGPIRYGETVANVVKSQGSGRLYAKVWNGKSWEYVAGVIYKLREADRLSLEEAQAFGHQTGQCCVCSRTLTNPESVALGIGPICGGRI
jgi:hypothetical protein